MKKEDKVKVVASLKEALETYPHFYLTDMEALNADMTSKLRRECFKKNIKLIMAKNSLLKLAMMDLNEDLYSPLFEALKGNTAVMFCESASAPAKLIKQFTKGSKGEGKPQLKAAYAEEGVYIGAQHLDMLESIKSKEEVLADVIALLQSPVKNVLSSLQSGGNIIHGVLETLQNR